MPGFMITVEMMQAFFYLQVDKLEQPTPESLQARVEALYAIAEQFEIADYDGMNVVAV